MKNGTVLSLVVNRKRGIMGITHEAPELTPEEQQSLVGVMANILTSMGDATSVSLSEKSRSYLQLIAQGLTDQEIAENWKVTSRAVYALRSRTVTKLGAKTPEQAVLSAYKLRLID